jgi:hypothetical protein
MSKRHQEITETFETYYKEGFSPFREDLVKLQKDINKFWGLPEAQNKTLINLVERLQIEAQDQNNPRGNEIKVANENLIKIQKFVNENKPKSTDIILKGIRASTDSWWRNYTDKTPVTKNRTEAVKDFLNTSPPNVNSSNALISTSESHQTLQPKGSAVDIS